MASELYSVRMDEEDMGRLLLAVEVRRASAEPDERDGWTRILEALRKAFQSPDDVRATLLGIMAEHDEATRQARARDEYGIPLDPTHDPR